MQAIEFKVGNGKGIERINDVIESTIKYQALVTKFNKVDYVFGVSGISDIDFGTASNRLAMKLIRFLDDIRECVIDDGDIFDHINESGDVEFMKDVIKTMRDCNMNTIKYLIK